MMLHLARITALLLAFARPLWALQSVTTGFVILQGSYSTTTCTLTTAISLIWAPLNACMTASTSSNAGFIKYSADSNNVIYTSSYSDSACMTSSGVDVKTTTTVCKISGGSNGMSSMVYSATQPDAIFNVKSSGYVASIGYTSTDTKCTGTPTYAVFYPIRTCNQNQQYMVDASNNVYNSTYIGSCTSPTGMVTTTKSISTNCVTNSARSRSSLGQSSTNIYTTSLPIISASTLFQTAYAATGCSGNVVSVSISYGVTNCLYSTTTCNNQGMTTPDQPASFSYLCGSPTSNGVGSSAGITKLTTGYVIFVGYYADTATCAASSALDVEWSPLNVCLSCHLLLISGCQSAILSADTNFNIYRTLYTDSACKTMGVADVPLITTKCTANSEAGQLAVWGVPTSKMGNFYSATQPDAIYNVQSSGYMVYNATYTNPMCTGTPKYGYYITIGICPYQYFADASYNIYNSGNVNAKCTDPIGLVYTEKQTWATKCVNSASSYVYTASLPTTSKNTQISTLYSGTGCSGTAYSTEIINGANACPYTTPTCVNDPGGSASTLKSCGTSTSFGSFGSTAGTSLSPTAAPSMYNLQAIANSLQTNGALVSNALASAYPGIIVSNPSVTNDGTVLTATQNIPSGVTLAQASLPGGPFQVAYTQAVANSAGVPISAIINLSATRGRRLLTGVNMFYQISNAAATIGGSGTSAGAISCFAGTEMLILASGITKAMSEVQVGDRVLTVNAKGEQVFSDVVYLPHGQNEEHATFVQISTELGHDLKMTLNHILPAGGCFLSILPYVAAGRVLVGDCVQTASGREQVVSVDKVEGKGIYTIITMEELIVVNGIVATPYGGINPTLANLYYNLHRVMFTLVHGQIMVSNGLGWLQDMTEGLWTLLSWSA